MSEILLEQLWFGIKDILLTCKYYHIYWEEFSLIFIWVKKKKNFPTFFFPIIYGKIMGHLALQ